MGPDNFDVKKFIGIGCFSLIYEVCSTKGKDKGKTYAMKRFFPQRPIAIRCALREHSILMHLALGTKQSPFLSVLYYSFLVHGSPVLVISKGSGFDLINLLSCTGAIKEHAARFYTSEIICGLEHLHTLQIVHLDIKPANILLTDSGHVLITDFDRSYDISRRVEPPSSSDFTGTPYYMAPEIAQQKVITTKADIWSLGILMTVLVCGLTRLDFSTLTENFKLSKKGKLKLDIFTQFSRPLKSFLNSCLRYNFRERASISVVKKLRFYKRVNWDQVASGRACPPYYPSKMFKSVAHIKPDADPNDPLILAAAYGKEMPYVNESFFYTKDSDGNWKLKTIPPDYFKLRMAGMTPKKLDKLFIDFHFTNPCLHSNNSDAKKMAANFVTKIKARLLCPLNVCLMLHGAQLIRLKITTLITLLTIVADKILMPIFFHFLEKGKKIKDEI
ncbi:Putative ribosomal protein S6 kinase alpha-1 [Echinococcus granulosus]|uniref:Ribosomal protein S6 kinase alpha-1 n=2 Tax=Echinococcus granulosus TaxID=6210 RepID=W6UK14_ECHGR|nr:Putative ribosomal protein S6 kinase alpha-1 [Echinococcus granulosus]EUB61418.1 Putative ribosomal protein S6 kinase alpha-1 [Echinococcus granulosus]